MKKIHHKRELLSHSLVLVVVLSSALLVWSSLIFVIIMSYGQDFYSPGGHGGQDAANYDFGQFDYTSGSSYPPSSDHHASSTFFDPNAMIGGSINTDPFGQSSSDDPYADEPPLLEELGINFDQITEKTLAVVNPLRATDANILQDSDLAGPLVFCLALGVFLLLSGKVSFGYIYGIGLLGCLSMYALLNLMAPPEVPLSVACTVSVLGYCLLPMVLLSGVSVLISLKSGFIGTVLVTLTVSWCSLSASKLFVTALQMHNQQPLVLYPCVLVYGVFALITVF